MRDPERIDEVLNELGKIWKQYPDLRLGQLIDNAIPRNILFYIEDDKLPAAIALYYTLMEEKQDGEIL